MQPFFVSDMRILILSLIRRKLIGDLVVATTGKFDQAEAMTEGVAKG